MDADVGLHLRRSVVRIVFIREELLFSSQTSKFYFLRQELLC